MTTGIAFPFTYNDSGKIATSSNQRLVLDKLYMFCKSIDGERLMFGNWSSGIYKILFSSIDTTIKLGLLRYEITTRFVKYFPDLVLENISLESTVSGQIDVILTFDGYDKNIVIPFVEE